MAVCKICHHAHAYMHRGYLCFGCERKLFWLILFLEDIIKHLTFDTNRKPNDMSDYLKKMDPKYLESVAKNLSGLRRKKA